MAKRLRNINYVANKLQFKHDDAFNVICQYKDVAGVAFFIDPPYTAGGKKAGSRLYTHYDLDHEALFDLCASIRSDFIMTYDNAHEVKDLAKQYGFQAKPVPMKNTHHAAMTELVIGKDLAWMTGVDRVPEEQARYNPER